MESFDYSKEPGKSIVKGAMKEPVPILISIITPYYNAEKYIVQTYQCIINQTFPYFEWIIVDDGSTNSISKILELKELDKRIRVVSQKNSGQAKARNLGISLSQSEIIVPLDADDLISPTYLELIYWGLKVHEKAGWCYTDSVGFQEQEYVWEKSFSYERMKYNNFLVCTAGIRKKALLKVGGYDESSSHYDEDWKLWIDLLNSGEIPVHIAVKSFWYRRTSGGMGNQVRMDKTLLANSNKIISSATKKMVSPIQAIEYPRIDNSNKYNNVELCDWNIKNPESKSKPYILMILPWLEMGGADLFNLEFVKMAEKGIFNIGIITTVYSSNIWKQRFEEYTSDIFELPNFLPISSYTKFISYFIQTRNVDLIFLSNSYLGYYLLPWVKNTFPKMKIIDYVHMEEWYWRSGGYARTSAVFQELLDGTYVCNERTRKVMIDDFGCNENKIKTVYIGVDKEFYKVSDKLYGVIYKKFQIPKEKKIILFPCRIHPQKRPFFMANLAKKIYENRQDIVFLVVGDGPQLEELRVWTKENKLESVILFAGRVDDMRPYYQDCILTLICSLKEGLSLTAYESLAMNTPVISSDVGGQKELIDDTVGKIITLRQSEEKDLDNREYDSSEIDEYIEAIEEILDSKKYYEEICNNCREKIENRFSTDIMRNLFEHEIKKLLYDTNNKAYYNENLYNELFNLYAEYEMLEFQIKNVNYSINSRDELVRIANSKWGKRLIKLAFKFKINKLFH